MMRGGNKMPIKIEEVIKLRDNAAKDLKINIVEEEYRTVVFLQDGENHPFESVIPVGASELDMRVEQAKLSSSASEIADLAITQAERIKQLEAHVERIKQHAIDCVEFEMATELEHRLEETPAQSLQAIRDEAILCVADKWREEAERLPMQHESKSNGSSTYNWYGEFIRKLKQELKGRGE
jgi:hypothetical protein